MPKSLFQEIIFTIIMVFFMVYALICYNMTLAIGDFSNAVMLGAFRELVIMGPIAIILDMLLAGPLAKRFTFKIFNLAETKPIFIILSISVFSVMFMCPIMSLAATILFKGGFLQSEVVSIWVKTTIMNFPMAFFWQLCFAGPVVRRIFALIFGR
ncbi:MAG: DUF2798 domain-containing protein [Treponema sp.]|uniref:DUF2798 domain-containing protein n=1 Tax=Treponema sp. TaxID=166 RepID=UPI002600C26F|nr:DUF2798 domain-containing protein [Treponema sp.]MBQ8680950.1 DUF2798 domain-containing protein [Treponema sp.]